MSLNRICLSTLLFLLATLAGADDTPRHTAGESGVNGAEFIAQKCAGCHAVTPGEGTAGIEERAKRSGPPLYYAGNKYREDWLRRWLQAPTRIYPSGFFPPNHVRTTSEGDVVDEASLVTHPVLGPEDAEAVTGYLMELKPFEARLAAESYEPGTVPLRMGQLDFRRFKGCNACHQDVPEEGGVSGPELHTAWMRLNPDFIVSFIRDPTLWNPDTMMPVLEMNDTAIQKLANYLNTIAEE